MGHGRIRLAQMVVGMEVTLKGDIEHGCTLAVHEVCRSLLTTEPHTEGLRELLF